MPDDPNTGSVTSTPPPWQDRPLTKYARETRCMVCGHNWDWHLEHRPRHRFSPEGSDGKLELDQQPELAGVEDAIRRLPTDPILRLALIDKGILTPEDLAAAEAKLRASGGIGVSGRQIDAKQRHPAR